MALPISKELKRRELLVVVAAIREIAEALASLAEEDIFHRDIKPSNLFRFAEAFVVGDFGVADFPGKEDLTARRT